MIQRYGYSDWKSNEFEECDNGEFVKYEDHLKEVERSNKQYVRDLLKEHKIEGIEGEEELVEIEIRPSSELLKKAQDDIFNAISSFSKPKWIQGPPTTIGWCWLKYVHKMAEITDGDFEIDIDRVYEFKDGLIYFNTNDYWCANEWQILAHCEIQEPVDE